MQLTDPGLGPALVPKRTVPLVRFVIRTLSKVPPPEVSMRSHGGGSRSVMFFGQDGGHVKFVQLGAKLACVAMMDSASNATAHRGAIARSGMGRV